MWLEMRGGKAEKVGRHAMRGKGRPETEEGTTK